MNAPTQTADKTKRYLQPVMLSDETWARLHYRARLARLNFTEYLTALLEAEAETEEE